MPLRPLRLRSLSSPRHSSSLSRTSHTSPRPPQTKPELSIADAQHKPSLSDPSIGHLISELSSTNLSAAARALRADAPGGTIPEAQRAGIRRVAYWIAGVGVAVGGGLGFLGWFRGRGRGGRVEVGELTECD